MFWRDIFLVALLLLVALAIGCGSAREPATDVLAPQGVVKAGDAQQELAPPPTDAESARTDSVQDNAEANLRGRAGETSAPQRAEDPGAGDVVPVPPAERFVIFTPAGPLLCTLSATVAGAGVQEPLDKLVASVYASLDASPDAPPTWTTLLESRAFEFGQFGSKPIKPGERKQTIARFDWNRNDLVEPGELRRLLTGNQGRNDLLTLRSSDDSVGASAAAGPTWRLLDANQDQLLSADEIAAAPERLSERDAQGNESLTLNELNVPFLQAPAKDKRGYSNAPPLAQLVADDTDRDMLRKQVRNMYPKPRSGTPTLPLVRALDRDGNGTVSATELAALKDCTPQVVIIARFGQDSNEPSAAPLSIEIAANPELWLSKSPTSDGSTATLAMPGLVLGWAVVDNAAGNESAEQVARLQFMQLDADANGYIDRDEAPALERQLAPFEALDANADDKIYVDEMATFIARRQAAAAAQITIDVRRGGDPLFAPLDSDGDGRLGGREIARAAERLVSLDRDADGQISPDEVSDRIVVRILRGARREDEPGGNSAPARTAQARNAGPRWFTRMDSNGDGDLSPREFLGTRARFDTLDVDGDGFIDVREAEQADKASAPAETPPP